MYETMTDGWMANFLEYSFVLPSGEIDGRDENYESHFSVELEDGPIVLEMEDGYKIQAINLDVMDYPLVVCRHPNGKVCGWYQNFMSWIDEPHRGRGLGVAMILEYARHYRGAAWDKDEDGIVFSEAGFAIHRAALSVALARSNITAPEDSEMPNITM